MFMTIMFIVFVAQSILLLPFAWVVGCIDKYKAKNSAYDEMDKIGNFLFYPFGLVYLSFDLIADLYYFWVNNFRDGLKKNIIVRS